MTISSIGWDIGGAHVKAAVIDINGNIVGLFQYPCPLWQGLAKLEQAVTAILQQLPVQTYQHAITMTGELVDCFDNRDAGVQQISAALSQLLGETQLFLFVGLKGLVPIAAINPQDYFYIASANWLASATLAAETVAQGLFVDIGSTTTDIITLKNQQVTARGFSDYQRLVSQEMVYTGIIRTPVMAIAQSVSFEGREVGLMAEYFATMADVYRVTTELNEAHDQTATADGAEKTVAASARRLSRMIGCDFSPAQLSRWRLFAEVIRELQLQKLLRSCRLQLDTAEFSGPPVIVGAGVGRFLAREIAGRLGAAYMDFSDLYPHNTCRTALQAADCAPAVAMAVLAHRL